MYTVIITYADGTVIRRDVFGRIQAYTLYYNAKSSPDVVAVEIKGVSV